MKKIHLALLTAGFALSASAFAFEGTIVKVPPSTDRFFVGLEALWLQATDSNGDLDWATHYSLDPNGGVDESLIGIEPDFGWGWRLTLGYEYGAANDFTFNYFRYHPKTTDDDAAVTAPDLLLPPYSVLTGVTNATASVDYEIDQADFTMGQKIAPHRCITLHPFGGLRYARVKRDLDSTFFAPLTTTTGISNFSDESKFSGIGPIAGLDVSFEIGNGFKIVGKADGGLLVGDMEDEFTAIQTFSTGTANAETISADKRRRVVPVADLRLGAAYTWDMGNDSTLGFEVGYQVSTYQDAIDKLNMGLVNSVVSLSNSVITPSRTTSDLGLHGAYLNVVWKM